MQTLFKHKLIKVDKAFIDEEFAFNEEVKEILSMQVTASDVARLYEEGISFSMTLDGRTVLPKDYPVKPLIHDSTVPANQRYVPIVEEAVEDDNGVKILKPFSVKISQGSIRINFNSDYSGTPYDLILCFKCLGDKVFQ